jgi:hypothetical protein
MGWWNGGVGGSGGQNNPTITFDDGQWLSWQFNVVPPPVAVGAPNQRVWVQMTLHLSVAGAYPMGSIDIRDAPGGNVLFMARAGHGSGAAGPTTDDLDAVFGTGADAVTTCSIDFGYGCDTRQTFFNYVVQTTPPQTISLPGPTQVTGAHGTFSVEWYTITEELLADGGVGSGACLSTLSSQYPLVNFVASRVPSP